jgi:hypothetical protein
MLRLRHDDPHAVSLTEAIQIPVKSEIYIASQQYRML